MITQLFSEVTQQKFLDRILSHNEFMRAKAANELQFTRSMVKYLLLVGISFGFSSPENYRCLSSAESEYSRKMEHLLSALQLQTLEPEVFEKQRKELYVNLEQSQEQCDRQLSVDFEEENLRIPASIPETQVAE